MRKTFCDACEKEMPLYAGRGWDIRLAAGSEHYPKTREEVSRIFPPHGMHDKEACSAECFLLLLKVAVAEVTTLIDAPDAPDPRGVRGKCIHPASCLSCDRLGFHITPHPATSTTVVDVNP